MGIEKSLTCLKIGLMRNFIKLLPLFVLFYSCSSGDIHFNKVNSKFKNNLDENWIVINYWADWCPPCIKEMPELSSFYEDNKQEVQVFAYNFDRLEGEELQEQILRFKVNVPSLLTDPGELFGWEVPESLPATYIIDPEGVTREVLIGPQTKESLEAIILKFKET